MISYRIKGHCRPLNGDDLCLQVCLEEDWEDEDRGEDDHGQAEAKGPAPRVQTGVGVVVRNGTTNGDVPTYERVETKHESMKGKFIYNYEVLTVLLP